MHPDPSVGSESCQFGWHMRYHGRVQGGGCGILELGIRFLLMLNSLRDWERAYIYVTFAYMQKPCVPNSTLDHTSTTDISSETFFCHGSVQHSYPGGFVLSSDMMFAPRRHVALSYSNDSCPMVSLVSPLSHTWLLGREQSMLTRRHRTV